MHKHAATPRHEAAVQLLDRLNIIIWVWFQCVCRGLDWLHVRRQHGLQRLGSVLLSFSNRSLGDFIVALEVIVRLRPPSIDQPGSKMVLLLDLAGSTHPSLLLSMHTGILRPYFSPIASVSAKFSLASCCMATFA